MESLDYLCNTSVSQGVGDLGDYVAGVSRKVYGAVSGAVSSFSDGFIRLMSSYMQGSPGRAFAFAGSYASSLSVERQQELAVQGYSALKQKHGSGAGRELARLQKAHKNFTLVELLVVISIISVLASMLLPAMRRAQDKAHEAETINTLRQIQLAITAYKDEYGKYPPGNLIGPDQSYKVLPEQLKGYIDFPVGLRHSTGAFKDGFGNAIIYFEHNQYAAASETQEPPIVGSYNPATYQAFSKGRDGKRGSTGDDITNRDNPWVDVKHNNVVMFGTVKEDKGI